MQSYEGEEIRQLGTVEAIREIKPHTGADRLELAVVRGWEVIVEKGLHSVGDLVVYLEVDTVIPEELLKGRKEYEMMKQKKFRVRTIKLRGEISQGLCLPLDILPYDEGAEYPAGANVTETLGLEKYEPPLNDDAKFPGTRQLGTFPKTVPKTDLKRVQNIADRVPKYADIDFFVTEKVDGASMTVLLEGEVFKICSKNIHVSEESKYGVAAKNLEIEEKLRAQGLDNVALQGELVGPTVSGNRYRLKDFKIYFFSVLDTTNRTHYPTRKAKSLVESLGLQWVPTIHTPYTLPKCTYADLVTMATGPSTLGTPLREGLVFQADANDTSPRFAFKAISNDYLIKHSL